MSAVVPIEDGGMYRVNSGWRQWWGLSVDRTKRAPGVRFGVLYGKDGVAQVDREVKVTPHGSGVRTEGGRVQTQFVGKATFRERGSA